MPPAVFSSASSGSTTTRSSRGRIFSFAMIVIPSIGGSWRGSLSLLHHAHAAHATHTAHAAHAAHPTHAVIVVVIVVVVLLLLGDVGHAPLGGQQQGGDAGAVLQGAAGHLDRVDDAGLAEVGVGLLVGVVA